MGLLHRPRLHGDVVEREVLAFERERTFGAPCLEDEVEALFGARRGLIKVETKAVEFTPLEAAPYTEVEAAVRKQVDRRRLFDKARRVVQRQDEDAGTKPDARRAAGEKCEN